MIHTDTNTDQTSIPIPLLIAMVPIPDIFTKNTPGICIGIGTIPILELIPIPIPILDKDSYRYRYRYCSDIHTDTGLVNGSILIQIPIPGIGGTLN